MGVPGAGALALGLGHVWRLMMAVLLSFGILSVMQIEFRRARPSDAAEVGRLYKELVSNPDINVTPDAIGAIETDRNNLLLLAVLDGRVVGTAFLVICRDVMFAHQPFAVVENVALEPGVRGRGLGRALMEYIKAECKSRRCTKIMLMSSASRADAHRFFEKCGYRSDSKKAFVNYINR